MKKLLGGLFLLLPFLLGATCINSNLFESNGSVHRNIRDGFRRTNILVAELCVDAGSECANESLYLSNDVSSFLDYWKQCMEEWEYLTDAFERTRVIFTEIEFLYRSIQDRRIYQYTNYLSVLLIEGNTICTILIDLNIDIPEYFQESLNVIENIIQQGEME